MSWDGHRVCEQSTFSWKTETIVFGILHVLLDKALKAAVFVRPIFQVVKRQSDSVGVQNYR